MPNIMGTSYIKEMNAICGKIFSLWSAKQKALI